MCSRGFVDSTIYLNAVEKGVRVGKCRGKGGRIEEPSGEYALLPRMPSKESQCLSYLVRSSRSSCVEMGAFCGSGFTAFALTRVGLA